MNQDKLDYFMERTDERLGRIESKIEGLYANKYLWTGGIVTINAIIGYILIIYFGR